MLFRASVVALSTLLVMPLPAAGQLVEGASVRVTVAGTLADDGSVTQSGARQSVVARFSAMEPGHSLVGLAWGLAAMSRCESKVGSNNMCGLDGIIPVVVALPVGTIAGVVIEVPRWVRVPPTAFARRANPAANGVQISSTLGF